MEALQTALAFDDREEDPAMYIRLGTSQGDMYALCIQEIRRVRAERCQEDFEDWRNIVT